MTPSYAWECVKAGWSVEKDWKPAERSGNGLMDSLKNGWNRVADTVTSMGTEAIRIARAESDASAAASAIAVGSKPFGTRQVIYNARSSDVAAVQIGRGMRRAVNQATNSPLAAAGWVAAAFFSSKLHPLGNVLPFVAGLSGAVLADPYMRAFMSERKDGKNDAAIDNVGQAAEAVDRAVGTASGVLNADKLIPLGVAGFFFGAYLLNRLAPKTSLSLGTLPVSMITWAVIGRWLGTEAK